MVRSIAAVAAVGVIAALALPAAAQTRSSNGDAVIVALSDFQWHETTAITSDEGRMYAAVGNIQREPGNMVTMYQLEFYSGLDFIVVSRVQIDCNKISDRSSEPRKLVNPARVFIADAWDNKGFQPRKPGTLGHQSLQRICTGNLGRVLADPVATGNKYIGR